MAIYARIIPQWSPLRDSEGEIQAASAVYLDAETGDKLDSDSKRAFGKVSGAYVEVQKADLGVTIIAEGGETALSLKEAQVPGRILAGMGIHNFKHYEPQSGEVVMLAADNDGDNNTSAKTLEKATTLLTERGAEVTLVQPEQRGDFNDVLQAQGCDAVYQSFKAEVAQHLSKDWLEVWEKGERMVLAEDEMLSTTDGTALKETYRENHQARREGFNTFVAENAKAFEHLSTIDANYDMKGLQKDLLHMGADKRDDCLSEAISRHETVLQENQERASTPYHLTQAEAMTQITENFQYLEDGYKPELGLQSAEKDFGVKDFQGQVHDIPNQYLLSLGQDKSLQPLIDYDSPMGQKIQAEVDSEHRKLEAARQQTLALARERGSTPYHITKAEFEEIVKNNIQEIKDGYRGDMKFLKDPEWGVKDFRGNNYRTCSEYLSALGGDKALRPLIDRESDLGKEIFQTRQMEIQLERSRDSGLSL